MSDARIHGILLEVKALAVLATWEPVGSRLQALTDAIQGVGSVSDHALIQLRTWARRWGALGEPRRAFYLRHIEAEETVRVALWRVLNGSRVEEWQERKLAALWEQDTGCRPFRLILAPIIE